MAMKGTSNPADTRLKRVSGWCKETAAANGRITSRSPALKKRIPLCVGARRSAGYSAHEGKAVSRFAERKWYSDHPPSP